MFSFHRKRAEEPPDQQQHHNPPHQEQKNNNNNNKDEKVMALVSSAPNSSKFSRVTKEIQDTIQGCTRRSNSFASDGRYKCAITSERLAHLKKVVETAAKEHRVFSIKGGWPIIRKELMKRNWLEKVEPVVKQKFSPEDVASNLPAKKDTESQQAYVEKCEKMVMSRMLQNFDVDFYWSMRKEHNDLLHRSNTFKLISRFSRSLFASKEGLALLLQQAYWYMEAGVAVVNYPRVYVLGFPDHYNLFIDDFRTTACIGLLKWFAERFEAKQEVKAIDGKVPYRTIQFAIDRCEEYVMCQKHVDIDKEFPRTWDHEWDQFLSNYYMALHEGELFMEFAEPISSVYNSVKAILKDMRKYWPQYDIDGMKNIWILKPGNKCRGRGIHLIKDIMEVEKIMTLKVKYVVQKYIERPLIIYHTKFDIRQWFMVTNVQPLTIWMYRDSYLRFSSQIFNLNNFHESLHLTNHSIQCKYANMQHRNKALPDDNMWDCHTFKAYLKQIGCMEKWNEVVFPGMRQSIVCAMLASQETMDRRQNTFEIYGADFMLSEDFKPWLIEINCSPDLSFSTTVTSRLCAQCMEDIIKVVIDKRKDPAADTGLFEMVYKQNFPRTPPYLGMNLSLRGKRILRNKPPRSKYEKEREKEKVLLRLKSQNVIKRDQRVQMDLKGDHKQPDSIITRILPKLVKQENYKGPIIEDFIQGLHKNQEPVAIMATITEKKAKAAPSGAASKSERVARGAPPKPKTNSSYIRSVSSNNSKRGGKESSSSSKRRPTGGGYSGLFRRWASRSKGDDEEVEWERETASILKGKNIFAGGTDHNRNYYETGTAGGTLNAFDLNQLLPQLNAKR